MLTINGNTFRWHGEVIGYFTPPQHLDSRVRDFVKYGEDETYTEEQVAALVGKIDDAAKELELLQERLVKALEDEDYVDADETAYALYGLYETLNGLDVEES